MMRAPEHDRGFDSTPSSLGAGNYRERPGLSGSIGRYQGSPDCDVGKLAAVVGTHVAAPLSVLLKNVAPGFLVRLSRVSRVSPFWKTARARPGHPRPRYETSRTSAGSSIPIARTMASVPLSEGVPAQNKTRS